MSKQQKPIEAYPLAWPDGWKRTENADQDKNPKFKMTLDQAVRSLVDEVRMLGGDKLIISTNVPVRKDGLPFSDRREPNDSGVAAYFQYRGDSMCFACDKYYYVRENVRAIALTINALRGIERWGASDMMARAFRGFTAIEDKSNSWRDVLDISLPNPTEEDIRLAFKEKAKTAHPDKGGSLEDFQELIAARDHAINSLSR